MEGKRPSRFVTRLIGFASKVLLGLLGCQLPFAGLAAAADPERIRGQRQGIEQPEQKLLFEAMAEASVKRQAEIQRLEIRQNHAHPPEVESPDPMSELPSPEAQSPRRPHA